MEKNDNKVIQSYKLHNIKLSGILLNSDDQSNITMLDDLSNNEIEGNYMIVQIRNIYTHLLLENEFGSNDRKYFTMVDIGFKNKWPFVINTISSGCINLIDSEDFQIQEGIHYV